MISEKQARTALVEAIKRASGIGKVYSRYRVPADGRDEEFRQFYVDEEGRLNVVMVRRVRRLEKRTELGDLESVTHEYTVLACYGFKDRDESEETYQELLEGIAAELNDDVHLGLGPSVTASGLEIPTDITDKTLVGKLCHTAECRVGVTISVDEC